MNLDKKLIPIRPDSLLKTAKAESQRLLEKFKGLRSEHIGHSFLDGTEGDLYRALCALDACNALIFPEVHAGTIFFNVRHNEVAKKEKRLTNGPRRKRMDEAVIMNYKLNMFKMPKINTRFIDR